ncbi:uncharacterized protein LOC119946477 isoform X2 [Tachyglossus aculeatus]|uniref:uncharacterized protein LOC119946477 isoform X2 n=1 Tax=Tachyglossus aculeatus TaxID=9261 RepID=UPI0018F2AE04|nr:uncharacterized protein LOC119946477 isoform X2 [Tachyglossus aculeatus]XP_038623734.1 uncharacterized protein LOC119946477 isoform X2 [Tachyglossus aculeatus]
MLTQLSQRRSVPAVDQCQNVCRVIPWKMKVVLLSSLLGLLWEPGMGTMDLDKIYNIYDSTMTFDINKFSGQWYLVGRALDSVPEMLGVVDTISVTSESGSLQFDYHYYRNGKCITLQSVAKKISYWRYEFSEDSSMFMLQADYLDYAILLLRLKYEVTALHMMVYLSRDMKASEEGLKAFSYFVNYPATRQEHVVTLLGSCETKKVYRYEPAWGEAHTA